MVGAQLDLWRSVIVEVVIARWNQLCQDSESSTLKSCSTVSLRFILCE